MAIPPLDLLPPTVAVKRVAWGVRVGRALASPASLSPKQAARPQPPHFAPVKATPWLAWDLLTAGYIVAVHLLACAAPFTYTPSALRCFAVTYVLSGLLGVTFCYHRLLSHKSFVVPKWIEYFCAYCGSLSSQSDPAEWVSFHRLVRSTAPEPRLRRPLQANTLGAGHTPHGVVLLLACGGLGPHHCVWGRVEKTVCHLTGGHRFSTLSSHQHHVATDQVGDPHSPLQSAWWSHVGWLFDRAAVRVRLADAGVGTAGETSNVKDLLAQRFYVFMEATYELHLLASVVALYLLGGLPWVTWGYGLRTVVLCVSPPPPADLCPAAF